MSGFAAIIRFDKQPVDFLALHRMTAAMDFRAQDGIRHEIGKTFALGHCQFHTTAESFDAEQPLFNNEGELAIVMDGWLANPDELRAELLARKARLRNRSDAELILHAYDAWADDCVDHLEGEFAFVIYDRRNDSAFCAKDHIGMRPLHYHWDGQRLLVASDIAAILAAGDFPQSLNSDAMAEHLAGEFHHLEETVWTGVTRLPMASVMRVDRSGLKTSRYWAPDVETTLRYRRQEEYFEHYREVLLDCVRRASRSQAPVAYEVSGGHDSSALFALARRLKETDGLPAPDALGFTLTGVPGEISDEIEYARDVGRFLGVPIHEAVREVRELSWFEGNVRRDRELPFSPNGESKFSQIAIMRKHGCRVVIDGEGGDEFVGGTDFVLYEMLREGNWRGIAGEMSRKSRALGWKYAANRLFYYGVRPSLPAACDAFIRRFKRPPAPSTDHLGAGPHWVSEAVLQRLAVLRESAWDRDETWRIRHPAKRRMLRNLISPSHDVFRDRFARIGARLGMESRTPMYSRRYIEFAFSLPEQMRFQGGCSKYIHLRALTKDMPRSVLDRRHKSDFGFTFDRQIKPLDEFFAATLPNAGLPEIRAEGVRNLYDSYEKNGLGIWELWGIYGWHLLKAAEAGLIHNYQDDTITF